MDDWRRHGSFRQRAKKSEKITRHLKQVSKAKVAEKIHVALKEFEENLRQIQEGGQAFDDLPLEADAHNRRWHSSSHQNSKNQPNDNSSDTSSVIHHASTRFKRSESDGMLARRSSEQGGHALPDQTEMRHRQRPPSPLHIYDYGGLTVRPRSRLHQMTKSLGEQGRPKHRQDSCGHYFPGPDCRQGPYGMSLLDPIHMPPRHWDQDRPTPDRFAGDPADLRPVTAEGRDRPKSQGCPLSPDSSMLQKQVKFCRGQQTRDRAIADSLGKRRDEHFLEFWRFEQGVYDGRWRDPMLDSMGMHLKQDDPPSKQHSAWAAWRAKQDDDQPLDLSSRLLQSLAEALREHRAKLCHLFGYVNRGVPGILEPSEFLEGLQRLRILEPGELTELDLIEVMRNIDPNFDGRVNYQALNKAIVSYKNLIAHRKAEAYDRREVEAYEPENYGTSVPVETVRIDLQPRSRCDFEASFDKFQFQQTQLSTMMDAHLRRSMK
eukprot:TRINITY_DN91284_c0_g1_i1.p1 TRINITY_DN91284_c0_g1~~TRINITY_DN91284_c0_g1_i1.p1  ORF type:complete len:504 (+),score=80.71 TRINITY_DN91284_c0_g1_i1:46-1512(+)